MYKNMLAASQIPANSPAISEDYSDIIFRYQLEPELLFTELSRFSPQIVDTQYSILHAPLSDHLATVEQIGYSSVPNLFTYVDTVNLETAGIISAQNQPFLSLKGKGVLVGFLDSGIDYTHPAFRSPDGTTRILRIWDQTIQTGPSPDGMAYGTEYKQEQINEALSSLSPYDIVPQRDEAGHGTAVAGIACGSPDPSSEFIGAAPESMIIAVKLKPAKQYLRDYFLIPEGAAAFQETDLMLGVRYMVNISKELQMPLVICITLGTNQGGHTGTTPLEDVLTSAQFNSGVYAVAGTGNEVGSGHHYFGEVSRQGEFRDIEILVDEDTAGFTLEFWADAPELYSVGFTSPLGETIQPIQPRSGASIEFNFLLENSRISLTYFLVEMLSGSQLALMRFITPTPGVWRVRVTNISFVNGAFHLWLPITGHVNPTIRFYTPNTDTTLVIPSCAEAIITTGTFNAFRDSIFQNSGRGYTRNQIIKPEFVTPGVNATAPFPGNTYKTISGSCAASALAAGATALLVESGLRLQDSPRYFTPREIKSLFEHGAVRGKNYPYPNREWGYGVMNVYGIFEAFLRL
ncbi:MAG: S8 family peptidase [Lachnospiraceae bacterium]|nr:S8 family peptidase [Lachnospiraceae bacterium]MDD7078548.1 S8 family peptidase [Lachnospiraceae bacterium]MDY3731331.1 S8 family peptidase [Candidatus Choladocola sp.]